MMNLYRFKCKYLLFLSYLNNCRIFLTHLLKLRQINFAKPTQCQKSCFMLTQRRTESQAGINMLTVRFPIPCKTVMKYEFSREIFDN